ncbi:cation diffusion facilitator family transporter [Nitrincola tapanii]|uniref:Cation transporter n=1 Tax=Nitrincola tapanii TaxID=1708751 RepID=A0A5A9W5I5_9GAMM|nr:cation diffusion facilitator family transporter [Nitrincola tapanii]KAA0875803.1 cation transporter [Nitrincola tapanii]
MQEVLDTRRRAGQKVSIIGALVNSLLSLLKIIVGYLAGSAALVADGFHSLSDVVTDFMVVFLLGISHKQADDNHPWGHGRFETLGTLVLAIILMAVAGLMAYDSLKLLFSGEIPPPPGALALAVAALSIIANEGLFFYTLKVGKEINSNLIIANAWHHRSDSLSSIVVLIAIAGAMLGIWWLDALAAVLVALLIGKIGLDLLLRSLSELVDTGLPPERVHELTETALSVDGVLDVHNFKSRSMGGQTLLEMHLQVAEHLSASEAHFIGDATSRRLRERFDEISHIIYHIDTYDDQEMPALDQPSFPARPEITQHLDAVLSRMLGELPDYELMIYYSPRRIDLDIQFNAEIWPLLSQQSLAAQVLEKGLHEELKGLNWFGRISCWLPAQGHHPLPD